MRVQKDREGRVKTQEMLGRACFPSAESGWMPEILDQAGPSDPLTLMGALFAYRAFMGILAGVYMVFP